MFVHRLVLKSAEEDALEECMLVMKPCDPEDMASEDECIDEEVVFPPLHSTSKPARSVPWRASVCSFSLAVSRMSCADW